MGPRKARTSSAPRRSTASSAGMLSRTCTRCVQDPCPYLGASCMVSAMSRPEHDEMQMFLLFARGSSDRKKGRMGSVADLARSSPLMCRNTSRPDTCGSSTTLSRAPAGGGACPASCYGPTLFGRGESALTIRATLLGRTPSSAQSSVHRLDVAGHAQ